MFVTTYNQANPVAAWRRLGGLALVLAGSLLLAGTQSARAQTAEMDRTVTRVGEPVTLTLTFAGGAPRTVPQMPQVPGLIIEFSGQSSSITIINSQTTAIVRLHYTVTPTQAGDFAIPSVTFQINGQNRASPPQRLQVLSANASVPQQPNVLDSYAFTKLNVGKKEVYVGEIFDVMMKLYHLGGQNAQLPNLRCEGFTVGSQRVLPSQSQETISNQVYGVLSFRTTAVPVKVGKLTFGPAECNITVPVRNSNPADVFNPIRLVQMSPKSEAIEMNVLPLPTNNVPPSFAGAVGNYNTMSLTATPTNVMVGDPITVRVQVSGRGSLDNILLPALENWRDFKSYPPTSKVEMADQFNPVGTKSFEQVIMPQNADIKELPAFSFSYFDPEQKNYRTITQPAIPLAVRPSNAAAQQPTVIGDIALTQNGPAPQSEIVHIKTHLGTVSPWRAPLLTQTWFLSVQAVPVAAWMALLIRRKQLRSLALNPRLRRQREAERAIHAGLHDLKQHASANRAEEFFATVFRLLQEQLGARLDLPASAITEEVIEDRLRPGGAGEQTMAGLAELFDICNLARYGRDQTSQELTALVPRVEAALGELREMTIAA
jgi:hypothetical protein